MATSSKSVIKSIYNAVTTDVGDTKNGLYQFIYPKHLKAPVSLGILGAVGLKDLSTEAGKGMYTQKVGKNVGLRKLSSMTDSVLHSDKDANTVISPYIKAMNDYSSKDATEYAKKLERNIQNQYGRESVNGDLVFALHNLR